MQPVYTGIQYTVYTRYCTCHKILGEKGSGARAALQIESTELVVFLSLRHVWNLECHCSIAGYASLEGWSGTRGRERVFQPAALRFLSKKILYEGLRK